jgi:hypothetical protein
MLRTVVFIAISAVVSVSAVSGQVRPAPAAGDHVRVRSDDVSGTFTVMHVNEDSMTLKAAADGSMRTVSVQSIRRLDLWRGERSRGTGALRGAGYGAAIGMVLGAVIGYVDGDDEPGFLSYTAEQKAAIMGILGGGTGLVVGGGVGLALPGERWQRANVAWVSVAPAPDRGVMLSFNRRF